MKVFCVLALLVCLLPSARADYDFLHTALEAAVNAVLPCNKIDIVRVTRFITENGKIDGMNFSVSCVEPVESPAPEPAPEPAPADPEAPATGVKISWSPPGRREDGEIFDMSAEGDGYILKCGDEHYYFPQDHTSATLNLPPGDHSCRISAVDKNGMASAWSSAVKLVF